MAGPSGESEATPQLDDLPVADAPDTRVPLPEQFTSKGKEKEGESAPTKRIREEFEERLAALGNLMESEEPILPPKATKATYDNSRPPHYCTNALYRERIHKIHHRQIGVTYPSIISD